MYETDSNYTICLLIIKIFYRGHYQIIKLTVNFIIGLIIILKIIKLTYYATL